MACWNYFRDEGSNPRPQLSLKYGSYLGLSSWFNIITREKGSRSSESEGFEGAALLALETEEAHPQENGWPPEAAKVRKQSLLEIPEGMQP